MRQIALEGEINRERQMVIKIPVILMAKFREMSYPDGSRPASLSSGID